LGVIADRRLSSSSALSEAGSIFAVAAATAVAAQVSVPAIPVPFTLQTLAVVASGLAFGSRRAAAGQLSYLIAGAAGLPIFAEGKFGPQWLFGATGGYLWAFVLVAWGVGRLAERGWLAGFASRLLAGLAAHAVVLLLGAGWLALGIGLPAAWVGGVMPFLVGSVAKSALAALTPPLLAARTRSE
jgi:biotin transport system substrate-specific component